MCKLTSQLNTSVKEKQRIVLMTAIKDYLDSRNKVGFIKGLCIEVFDDEKEHADKLKALLSNNSNPDCMSILKSHLSNDSHSYWIDIRVLKFIYSDYEYSLNLHILKAIYAHKELFVAIFPDLKEDSGSKELNASHREVLRKSILKLHVEKADEYAFYVGKLYESHNYIQNACEYYEYAATKNNSAASVALKRLNETKYLEPTQDQDELIFVPPPLSLPEWTWLPIVLKSRIASFLEVDDFIRFARVDRWFFDIRFGSLSLDKIAALASAYGIDADGKPVFNMSQDTSIPYCFLLSVILLNTRLRPYKPNATPFWNLALARESIRVEENGKWVYEDCIPASPKFLTLINESRKNTTSQFLVAAISIKPTTKTILNVFAIFLSWYEFYSYWEPTFSNAPKVKGLCDNDGYIYDCEHADLGADELAFFAQLALITVGSLTDCLLEDLQDIRRRRGLNRNVKEEVFFILTRLILPALFGQGVSAVVRTLARYLPEVNPTVSCSLSRTKPTLFHENDLTFFKVSANAGELPVLRVPMVI